MLKDLREKARLTQAELAEKLKTKQSTISNWETGVAKPSVLTVIRLAEILDASIEEVVSCFES